MKTKPCMYPVEWSDTAKRCGQPSEFERVDTGWPMCRKHAEEETGYRHSDRAKTGVTETKEQLFKVLFRAILTLDDPPKPEWCEHMTWMNDLKPWKEQVSSFCTKAYSFCPICGTPRPKE